MASLREICAGLPLNPLPPPRKRNPELPHAPDRIAPLTTEETEIALKNALRYFPTKMHAELAAEFAQELKTYGHIYMYRFIPNIDMNSGW